MQAGALNQRITLQSKVVSRDAAGGEVVTWAGVATVWAQAEPLRGREFFAAQQMNADLTVRFRLRYRVGVVPEWRVLWREKQYDIVEVIDVNARRMTLELMCRSVINA